MTKPWAEIVAHFAGHEGTERSIRALGELARRIGEGPLANGLFGWTSMFALCIAQTEVTYPYDGPYLRLTPVSADQIEFRYLDSYFEARQWHRVVDAGQAFPRLLGFLDQLRWFPTDTLAALKRG